MAGPVHETLRKFHASINVSDLDRSIAFYRVLLGVEPAKVRSDYAKFELEEPPVILSLIPGRPGGNLNHIGLRLLDTNELVEVQRRLETAGIATKREDGVECCYARQTKFWVADPDRMLWEIYVFHEDIEERGEATVPLAEIGQAAVPPAAMSAWSHRLGEPFPGRIPHETHALREIALEGSANADVDADGRAGFYREALRVLRPGGEIRVHGLAGDRPWQGGKPDLPGPASAVEYVPTTGEVVEDLAKAGFVEIHVDVLSQAAYFVRAGIPMREFLVRAKKPGHRPEAKTHHAIYRGPLALITDDFGNIFRRGELTPLNVHDWQMLNGSAAGGSFVFVAPEGKTESCQDR